MPPKIALLFCTMFVCILLWIDSTRDRKASKVVWIPTLWLMYCASRSVEYWFTGGGLIGEGGDIVEGSPLDRILLSILIVIALMILFKRKINWSQVLRENRWLMIMFLYMLVSILWSDFPFVSFKRWVKTAGTVIMAMVVLTEMNPLESLVTIIRRTSYVLIPYSIVLIKYFGNLGRQYSRWAGATSWCGVSLTKNTLGALCVVSIFFLVWELIRRNKITGFKSIWYQSVANLLVLGMSIVLLRGPGGIISSATSFGVLIIGLSTFILLRRSKNGLKSLNNAIWTGVLGCALILITLNAVLDKPLMTHLTSFMGRDETLTGRTDLIWSELIPIALKNPVLGVGYGAFWIRPIFDFSINEAHNGYLDVFIELGIIGIILLMFLIISFYKKARAEFVYDTEWASLRISFLLIVLFHNMTESSFLKSTLFIWNMFVFLLIIYPKRNYKS
jgi:exopolysaccharide production protein ExoQ